MAKKTYIAFKVQDPGVVVSEYLRYAGIISVNDSNHNAPDYTVARQLQYNPETDSIVTMGCPRECAPEPWAKMNLARLKSFGVQAITFKK